MHQIQVLLKLTPLKLIATSNIPGVGTSQGGEVFPVTPILLDTLNLKYTLTPPPTRELNPEDVKGLRPYQIEDVKFLAARNNAGCFNEPRTGKTPTALTTFKVKGLKKFLVVCPGSAIYQWQQEIETWTNYKVTILTGPSKKRKEKIDVWQEGVALISYDTLKLKTYIDKASSESYELGDIVHLKDRKDIEGVILDEAHRIRNRKIKTTHAIFKLKHIKHKLILTGTSVIKEPVEAWTLLHFLYPKVFTSYWKFVYYYFETEERTLYLKTGARNTVEVGALKREQELLQFLNRMSTNRKRKDVMPWLPEKDYQTVYIPLTVAQKKYIKELREYYETGTVITVGILDTLIRERQICLDPELIGLKGESPKLAWLVQYIKDYPDKNIIIFSKFTRWLRHLSTELACPYLITGREDLITRDKNKKAFQEGSIKMLLINIDAGKEALTLDNADVAIFTDQFPPVGTIHQAENRFVATNKKRANKEHTIYHLIMKDSYEVNIMESLSKSAEEIDIINDYKKHLKGGE